MKTYIIYYQQDKKYRYIHQDGDDVIESDILPKFVYNCFSKFDKGDLYPNSDEGLYAFRTDFKQWVKELGTPIHLEIGSGRNKRKEQIIIDYTRYYTHTDAVRLIFFEHLIGTRTKHGKEVVQEMTEMDAIDIVEERWFRRCNNGGLFYFDETKQGVQDSYGYDYKSHYPTLLSKFVKYPTKRGKEQRIEELPTDKNNNVQFGMYHCRINYTDTNFHKLFNLSKSDVYTNISLDTALKYQSLGLFGVEVKLICDDGESNAYIYNSEDIGKGSTLFSFWYDTLIPLKAQYPNNLLIKNLLSSLWGRLSEYNKIYGLSSKFENKVYTTDFDDDDTDYYVSSVDSAVGLDDSEYLTLIPKDKIYKYNLRIKPFLTSISRSWFEQKIIFPNIDKVFRIMTDGAVFSEPIDISNINGFVPESKTTGSIDWKSSMEYTKLS